MKLMALVGAGLLAAGTMATAPADAQRYGHRYGYHHGGYGYRHGAYGYGARGYGYRRVYGYGHGYARHDWRYRHRYIRCRYGRC